MKSPPPSSIPSPISLSFSLLQQNASSLPDAGNPGSMVRSFSMAFLFMSHIALSPALFSASNLTSLVFQPPYY
jgi:hypothetical protein